MFTTSLKLLTPLPTTLREVARVIAFSFFCHPFSRACGLRDLPPTRNILLCNNNHQITMTNNVSGYSVRFLRAAALALALLASPFTAHSQNYTASSDNSTSTITISSGNHTISVGSSGAQTRSNAITLSGGTLQGGIMDNVATVSDLSGIGTSSTNVDANGVTIILRGDGTSATTANLTLASGVSVNGANQLLVGGGAGGGGGRGSRNRGGGGGGGFVVLTTGNLTGTLALTAGGGSAGAVASGGATASGGNSSIGATTASGGGGAASAGVSVPTGKGGDSGKNISGSSSAFTGGNGSVTPPTTGNGGGGGGAGSSANGDNGVSATQGGAGGNGTTITTGVVGLSTYMGSNTFGGGGGGGAQSTSGGAGGSGGGGSGGANAAGTAGTSGLGGGGGGGGGSTSPSGNGGAGGAGSVAIQYAYDSNVAAGNLTLSGGITLSSTSTLDAVRSGGLIDITTTAISGTGSLNIASSASSGGVVRFSVANTYSGTTTINSGATLELANVNALQNTTLDTGTSGSQVVSFTVAGANTYNIGAIQGGDTLDFGNNTISVGANNASTSFTGTLAGSGGSLIKAGTGTLTLSGASSSYDGTTTISAGTIQIDHDNALGSTAAGTTVASGAALELSGGISIGAEALSLSGTGISSGGALRNISGDNSYAGAITLAAATLINSDSGNLTLSGAISGTQNLTIGGAGNTAVSGNITTSTGTLTKVGAGTLTLSGAGSSYTGTTTLSAGTIQIGHANGLGTGGNITFSGGELKYGPGITTNLSARIKNSGSAILVDTNGQTVTWGTALASTNSGGLTKNGTGTLTIDSSSAYTGATAINGGKLVINNTVTATNWNPGAVAINNASTLEFTGGQTIFDVSDIFTFDSAGGGSILVTNNVIWRSADIITTGGLKNTVSGAGVFNGQSAASARTVDYTVADGSDAIDLEVSVDHSNVGITKGGAGTLTLLSTTNSMNLGITIHTGTLEIGGGGRLQSGSYANIIVNNGAFSYNSTATQTLSGNISGSGTLTKSNTSTLTLSGNNTYTGTTTINAGTIVIGAAGRLGAGSYAQNISNNGTLIYSGTNDQTLSGIISGTGALTKNAASTLTLSGDNTYSGATTINVGTLEIGNGLTAGSLNAASAITVNGALAFNRSDDITQGTHFSTAAIGGTGSIVQNGAGTLTLNAANTYSGGTTLNTGTVVIGHANAAGSGTITQTDGTSLLKIDTTGTITNAMSVYNVLATQSATLSGAITVNNATWDVDAGDTLTISGNLSGTGGTTKNGTGTLVLSGSNSNTGATTVNAGTLNAAGANALGSTSSVVVSNSGSLLVTAGDSINDSAAVTLAGGTLAVNGTFNESVGLLTLSASSVIDLDGFTGTLRFGGVGSWTGGTTLAIWNWNGFNQYGTPVGNGADNRHVVFTSNTGLDSYLGRISFYSDSGSSFAGTGFEQDFSGGGTEIIPVPEPGNRATGVLLVLSSGMWLWRKRKQAAWTFCQPAQKVLD